MPEKVVFIVTVEEDGEEVSVEVVEQTDPSSYNYTFGLRAKTAIMVTYQVIDLIFGKKPDLKMFSTMNLLSSLFMKQMGGDKDAGGMPDELKDALKEAMDDEDCAHCPADGCPIRKEPYVGEEGDQPVDCTDGDSDPSEITPENTGLPKDIVDKINEALGKKKE